ncbi:MAG: N-acetylmuramoyl-L-alanine amidase [Mycobacterium leprae]
MVEVRNIKLDKILVLIFLGMVLLLVPHQASAAATPSMNVTVEGKPLNMPVPPTIVQDRTLVSARSVGEAVGGVVEWDGVKRQVTITRQSVSVVLTLGKSEALVNGKIVRLEVPAQLVNNVTMVPLRFIAEALGGTVEWNAETRTANILRTPSTITGMTYIRGNGQATIVMALSEAPLSVTPKVAGNELSLDLYPAVVATTQTDQNVNDSLTVGLHLSAQGRTAHLSVQAKSEPHFDYTVSADGKTLTVHLKYPVTGISFSQDGRISQVQINAGGKLDYSDFTLDTPTRIVVDIKSTPMADSVPDSLEVGKGYVTRVRTAARGSDIRVVLDMAADVPYRVVNTDQGLIVQFVPLIQAVKTEKLAGKTRLTLVGSLPVDARVSVPDGQNVLKIELPQAVSGLQTNPVTIGDGSVNSVAITPGATPNSSIVTVSLPYYLGHSVVSKDGDSSVVIDLVTSPVYGKRIWIDAGHGKIPGGNDDPGSIGRTYGTQEKRVNLAVALELQKRLQAAGAIVFMTRTGDEGVDYRDRPALVNALKPPVDLFISIHHNSSTFGGSRGTETYYWTTNPKSKLVAQAIHPILVKNLGFPDRGVRTDSFYVIKATQAPSILVELGFLSNPDEEKAIVDKTYAGKAAEAIKLGLFGYFGQENKQ